MALSLGDVLVGLGANVMHSLQAIAAPFTIFISTMAAASTALAKGEFAEAAAAFDGIGGRIVTSFQEHNKAATVAMNFIGDSLKTRAQETMDVVTSLMSGFSETIDRSLGEPEGFNDLGDAITGVGDKVELTGKQIEAYAKWWTQLRAEMDPVAEATRQYELALLSLDIAVNEFGLSATEKAARAL